MTIFSLKDLDNLSTDSCSASMAPVRAPVDHIVAFTMMESRVHDKASFNRFPNFRLYAVISPSIQILETPNRNSDNVLRAEYTSLLKLRLISVLRKVIQDNVFWSLSRTIVCGLPISKSNREDVYLCLRKYGLNVCLCIRLRELGLKINCS